ncbi:glycosyltransferase family 4 protein [Parafrankia soli]|uniref:glycosyltransferase family 4 protein n=1 Tax=Parafrankia soli TaxID=2599596 RepID=UPI001F524D80|nr:glycosyltransferase family 4 protein [Parafrankia soli]
MSEQQFAAEPGVTAPRVVLLTPSRGLGGGIERYLDTIEDHLRAGGANIRRFDLLDSSRSLTVRTQASYILRTLASIRRLGRVDSIVVGHVSLAPVACLAARLTRTRRVPVMFYGVDIWGGGRALRRLIARDPLLYPVTISSYSAGGLVSVGLAQILQPGIPQVWRDILLTEGSRQRPLSAVPTVLSVFRLGVWKAKGLPELVEAVTAARAIVGPVQLVIAGKGPAPGALHELVAPYEYIELHESPDDAALAQLYATADMFALCTRTRTAPPFSGEGYGIVLMEAQLAGCAVVGPASGGSRDAYLEGVTGRTPLDESPTALAEVLCDMLADRVCLARMGRRAAEWAQGATDPANYTRLVMATLTGAVPRATSGPAIPSQRGRRAGQTTGHLRLPSRRQPTARAHPPTT